MGEICGVSWNLLSFKVSFNFSEERKFPVKQTKDVKTIEKIR